MSDPCSYCGGEARFMTLVGIGSDGEFLYWCGCDEDKDEREAGRY